MRNTVLLILALVTFSFSYAQKENINFLNFSLEEDRNLIWEKVYETTLKKDELIKQFKKIQMISELEFVDGALSGNTEKFYLQDKNLHPLHACSNEGYILVQIKEGRYKVKLSRLRRNFSETSEAIGLGKSIDHFFEDLYVRNNRNEISKNKGARAALKMFDDLFTKAFSITTDVDKDDW